MQAKCNLVWCWTTSRLLFHVFCSSFLQVSNQPLSQTHATYKHDQILIILFFLLQIYFRHILVFKPGLTALNSSIPSLFLVRSIWMHLNVSCLLVSDSPSSLHCLWLSGLGKCLLLHRKWLSVTVVFTSLSFFLHSCHLSSFYRVYYIYIVLWLCLLRCIKKVWPTFFLFHVGLMVRAF